jgi:hypothetical protein
MTARSKALTIVEPIDSSKKRQSLKTHNPGPPQILNLDNSDKSNRPDTPD